MRDGHLLGLCLDPSAGSPCAGCVERWLKDRHVWVERADLSELRVKRELIGELIAGNAGHVFYEIGNDGTATRLEAAVFPHPECDCRRAGYVAPDQWTKKTNFAFSPITQLRCARYSTAEGNVWVSCAVGETPIGKQRIKALAVGSEREESRFRAVEEWMKRAALSDLRLRADSGQAVTAESLLTGAGQILPWNAVSQLRGDGMGCGPTRDAAILDALHGLARSRTLARFATSMKSPMLIVGSNNWVRNRVPFFLLQEYDLHLLFYPNSMPSWVVGVAAFSRKHSDEKPLFAFGSGPVIGPALDTALFKILEHCRPPEPDLTGDGVEAMRPAPDPARAEKAVKLNLWWTHWIYRCPKIALKDVLHLEAYPNRVDHWRDYFKDGQYPVSVLPVNHELLPSAVRWVVKAELPVEDAGASNVRNIRGIGTSAAFQDALI